MPQPTTPRVLARRIVLQRLALAVEGLWAAGFWLRLVLMVGGAVILSGLLGLLPDVARLVLIAGLGLAVVATLIPLFRHVLPTRHDAMRRLDRSGGATHRAVSSLEDRPSGDQLNPTHDAIWEEHLRRRLLAVEKVKVIPPVSQWRQFDPRALGVPALLLLLSSALLGSGSFLTNMAEAVRLSPAQAPVALAFDAWIKPPAHTGKPPLLLTAESMKASLAAGQALQVPENSVFTARLSGAADPHLLVLDSAGTALDGMATAKVAEGVLATEFKLTRPLTIVVQDGTTDIARYPVTLLPDAVPTITITKPPHGEARGTLITDWEVKDDYGVAAITGTLDLADEQEGGTGFESNGVFLFDAPELKFALRKGKARAESGSTTHDFAAHPWAGLRVTMSLQAKDGAGQDSTPAEASFVLPQREFIRPMAQALIEQRKKLILFPEKAREIGGMLETLIIYPGSFIAQSGHVIAVASLASRLRNASGYDDVKLVVTGLWDVAVAIEEGSLLDARAELQALRKELEKALQDGASEERIAELMDRMRKAMDKFMDAMRKEAEQRLKDGTLPQQGQQQGRSLSRQDLQKMLDQLEEMAKGGAREQAEQMLSDLDQLLQNMQPGMGQQQGQGEMSDMLDQLGEMMKRQQGLMDETQKQGGQQPGEQPGEGQQGEGQEGQNGQGGTQGQGMGGLAQRQGALQDMLDRMMQGGQGQMPGELGDASRAMEGAEESLRNGDREGALQQQGEALQQLRKGAGKMAQQQQENGQGQAEGDARDGEGRGGRDDPLGRPRATRDPGTGPDDDMVPRDQAMRRAREILETLRAKSNSQGLTDSERAYIERLMRGLY